MIIELLFKDVESLIYTFLFKYVEEIEFLSKSEIGEEVRVLVEDRLNTRAVLVPLVFP